MKIHITVNGRALSPEITDESETLLYHLRGVLHLTAAKNGCGEGHCGACTVLINGKPKLSCIVKMKDLDGADIVTPESLSTETHIHAIIYAYIAEGAVQCGFCTPGFVMATKALLDTTPDPSEAEIRKALARNICRCTGYVKIIHAVRKAAALLRDGKIWIPRGEIYPDLTDPFGKSVPRIDALAKATGELQFADDLLFDNMLVTKVLRSEYPHAEITSLDVSAARKAAGVAAVLTAEDVPGEKRFGPIVQDQPVFADRRVRYLGDAVAAVYAETEADALKALELIQVTYKPLPVISSIGESLRAGAVLLHDNGKNSNIFSHMEAGRGDAESGLAEADFIMEGEYFTQYVEHAYLEPESCVCVPEPDGRLTVYNGSQGPEADIKEIAPVLGLTPDKIHIAHMPMGGGFGGKEDISVQIIASLGALKTGRPVKYTYTREESIRTSGKRNAQRLRYKTGVAEDGRITAVKADIIAQGGAYASVEEAVILRSVSFASGPYTIANADIQADACYTNNMPTCAMRGFGNPPVTFASEMQMNRIAEALGIDPFEIRLKNALREGSFTVTGEKIRSSVGITACLEAVRKALEKTEIPKPREGWKIGVGVAASYKNVGLGIGMDDSAGAHGELISGGRILVRVGSVDMGQGSDTTMAQIASNEMSWPYSLIRVHAADSDKDPGAGMTTASRQTFVSGNAVLKMAAGLRKKISAFVLEMFPEASGTEGGLSAEDLEIRGKSFWNKRNGKEIVSLESLAALAEEKGIILSEKVHYEAPKTSFSLKEPAGGYPEGEDRLHAAYCFAVDAVILEVNESSGKVDVHKVIAASDMGKAVNPASLEGQIEGGVMMGLGYALSEEFRIEKGIIRSGSYGKLGVPRIGKTPEIETILVESPHPEGPYGAKGMGELPLSPVAPAVVHAIRNAVGVWITSLPATPEKITAALASR